MPGHSEGKKISLKELLAASEAVLREDHPNPNREGCPDRAVLERLAVFPIDDTRPEPAILLHISECFPCFNELRQLRIARGR